MMIYLLVGDEGVAFSSVVQLQGLVKKKEFKQKGRRMSGATGKYISKEKICVYSETI